ncbi:MAG: 6-carboxytetrahydropterin synthase [Bacteroidota bacterium]
MVYVCRKEYFNAAHRLYREDWSPEKNQEVFGPCANRHWHGHNFELIVTAKGYPDPETGFVLDMKKLGDLVKKEVISQLQHQNMNEVSFLKNKIPTCEILVMEIWKILEPRIPQLSSSAQLHSIQLFETEKNFEEYFGEK